MNAGIRITMLAATLLAATAAQAGEVYQWKDAKGVTHYSDAPPPAKAGVKVREVRQRDLDAEAAATAAVAKPAVVPATKAPVAVAEAAATAAPAEDVVDPAIARANCETARTNLENLKSGGYVGVDNDGDGTPDKVLSGEDIARQTSATEGQVKTFCGAAGTP